MSPRVEGWYKIPARRGRRRYGSRCRSNLQAAAREIRRSRTQASLGGDVVDKNNRRKDGRQDSATRVMCKDLKRRRLAIYAPRILGSRTGTPTSRPRSTNGRRTVKSKREVGRTGPEFKNPSK